MLKKSNTLFVTRNNNSKSIIHKALQQQTIKLQFNNKLFFHSNLSSQQQQDFVLYEEIPTSTTTGNNSNNKNNKIAILTFNRPDKMNALCPETAKQFKQIFNEKIQNNKEIGALVLTGASNPTNPKKAAFSAGGDFNFLWDRANDQPGNNAKEMLAFYHSFLTPLLRVCHVPTVSALNGHAVGAGLAVSLATDIRIAESKAKLGVNFVKLGLSPGMGSSFMLPYLLGHQIASYLLLTGELISAEKAKEFGLVLEVLEGEESVKKRAIEIASMIANNPKLATQLCLKTMRMQQLERLENYLIRESDAQAQSYADKELRDIIETLKGK
ncbi:hypothetical protein ABK040_002554 [Willaertia magna]